jgi:hypothetical protein
MPFAMLRIAKEKIAPFNGRFESAGWLVHQSTLERGGDG